MGAPRLRLFLFVLLSTLGLALVVVPIGPAASQAAPAVAKDAPAAPPAQEATVDVVAFHARPEKVEITTGTTVTWVNKELFDYPLMSGSHEIKADDGSFASPDLAPGTRWSHRFLLPGTFTYHCAHHGGLTGQIVVTGPPIVEDLQKEIAITEPKPDDPRTWGFQPNDLIVTTGTTVVWRNNGTNKHTVTSNDNLFPSSEIPPGGTFSYKFDKPGAFGYHCTPHPWMTAAIRVVVPGGAPPPPPPPPPPAPAMPMTHRSTAASTGDGRGPVRHDVDIVEVNPADPTSWTFDPPSLDARAGDTVVWHNTGGMQHSVTASDRSFDSGLIPPGGTWSRTFAAPVYLDYHCTPHPWMKGVVRVAALTGALPPPPAAGLAGAGSTTAAAPPPEPVREGSGPVTHTVNIVEPNLSDAMSWGFNPKVVDARAGDTVVWRNTGTLQHSVTSDTFDAGLVDPGKTFSRRFDTPGLYAFHCTPHPWMKGVVRVTSAEGGAAPPIPADLGTGNPQQAGALPLNGAVTDIIAKVTGHGDALVNLGLALLFLAAAVGFTLLLSWAWTPVPIDATK